MCILNLTCVFFGLTQAVLVLAVEEPSPKHPVDMRKFTLTLADDQNQPVSGALVSLYAMRCEQDPASHYGWPTDNTGPAPQGKSNGQGEFTFLYPFKFGAAPDWRTTTQVSLSIRHPEFVSDELHIDPRDGKAIKTLKAGCELALSARDANGKAVTDFAVMMAGPGRSASWLIKEGMKRSRAIPDGKWQTMLVKPDEQGNHLFSGILPVRLAGNQHVSIRNVTLRPGLNVRGKLAEDVPRPVLGGKVIAWCVPKPAGRVHDTNDPSLSWCDEATITEDGAFEFLSLPRSGNIQLIAVCDGWIIKDDLTEDPRPGFKTGKLVEVAMFEANSDIPIELKLAMDPAGSVEVTVKTQDGQPLAGATVATWPNQALHLSGTQILGDSYPSIVEARAQMDPSAVKDVFSRRKLQEHYFQTSNQDGVAILRNIPLNRPESLAVDHGDYFVAQGAGEGLDRNLRFTCETTELKRIEIKMEPRPE